ncbi:unnamed protein product [Ceratitis capitata]|uniref:alpha-glucosidase n=1 Tax=Ceratitis capitata TaxID=7213 RepID=A0A811VE13_CERCA|nr:unnamed protein product [Ceratitis capitata]
MHIYRVFLAVITLLGYRSNVVLTKEWWENANYYQIYPRSFRDSNGDGIGDLNGITPKLQYLKDIGFTAAWLSHDFQIAHVWHNEDFKALIARAKQVGIRIILDFVPNHTSDECEWFVKSVNREPGYEDFYVWSNGTVDANGRRQPPSNWFAIKQADLNYRNPLVVAKMKEVMRFWLDIGISGFRIDALPFMFEKGPDANGNFPDEPVIDNVSECPDPDDWCHLNHTYTQDQPESIEMVYQWRELVEHIRRRKAASHLFS